MLATIDEDSYEVAQNIRFTSGLVYNYQCSRCNSRYLGTTFRSFRARG